jgi:hypothetical protein
MLFTWYYNNDSPSCYEDKIGISHDCKYVMHDGISHEIEKFKKFQKYEIIDKKNIIAKYLVYKLKHQSNYMFHEEHITIYFKYIGLSYDDIKFAYVGFNGGRYIEL